MLCRLCIFECSNEDSFDIFNNGRETDLIKLIVKYLYLEISPNDDISTKICSECMQHLKNFDDFFCYVKRRQDVMEAPYIEIEVANEIDTSPDMKFVNQGTVMDANETSNEYEQLNISDTMPQIMEFEESLDSESSTNMLNDVAKAAQQVETQKSKKTKQVTNKQSFSNIFEQLNSSANENKSNNSIKFIKSQAEITDEKDKFIEKHIQLKCKICRNILNSFKNFQRHFREMHQCPAYIKCCGTRLYSRHKIIKHIQTHVNPDLFKCHICNKILSSQKNLSAHIASFHTDKDKLPYACEICGDRFTTSFILKTHMIVHEEGHSYTCEICNKTFKHLRSVKRHKRVQHGNNRHHVCELCGKNYKYKQIFEQHMADKHKIISNETMKYCEECKCWFSKKYDKKHAERHELKDVECKYCGKICPSKAALDKHLDVHYHKKKCQTCGTTFSHPKDLREHMKTHLN